MHALVDGDHLRRHLAVEVLMRSYAADVIAGICWIGVLVLLGAIFLL